MMLWEIIRDINEFNVGTVFEPTAPSWIGAVEVTVKHINNHPTGDRGKLLIYSKHDVNEKYVSKPVNLVGNAIKHPWKLKF